LDYTLIYLSKNIKMKKLFLIPALAAVVCLSQSCNNNRQQSNDSIDSAKEVNDTTLVHAEETISDFMIEAASSGMKEVELGKIAEQKSTNKRVKDFAKLMVTEHTKSNMELQALAQAKSVTLPGMMGDKDQKVFDDLRAKSGAEFDKGYMNEMVDGHQRMVNKFKKRANEEDKRDSEVSAFAQKNLTHLQMHLDSARAIYDAIK
jgi:putative membrane protein